MIELAAVFAVAGAASNAMGTAFQRKAAATSRSGLRLLAELVHRAAWVIGMAGVIGAAVFQPGPGQRPPGPRTAAVHPGTALRSAHCRTADAPPAAGLGWWGVLGVVAGLALVLASAAPHGATDQAP